MKREYRSKIRIYIDILEAVSSHGVIQITHIMQEANLSYDRLVKYLQFLENKGLIIRVDSPGQFRLTEKGAQFLREFKKFEGMAAAFGIRV